MIALRERQLKLLQELDAVCRDNGIPYILSEYTAYSAAMTQDFYDETAIPTVAMRCRDAMRLKALLTSENRCVDSALENRRIDRLVMRYCDSSTFFYNAEEMESFTHMSIGVDIELIRGVASRHLFDRVLVAAEAASVVCAKLEAGSSPLIRPVWVLLGEILRRSLRLVYTSRRLDKSNMLRICRYPHKSVTFPSSFLSHRSQVTLRGCAFPVPEDLDKYLRCEVDYDWSKKLIRRDNPDLYLSVWDTRTGKEDYRSLLGGRCRVNWFHWLLCKARIRHLRQKLEWYWEVLLCTEDRFRLARQYLPQKEELLRLNAQGDREALRERLADCLHATERHMQHGIGLCFDADILDMTVSLLGESNGSAYAARLRDAVPPIFLTPPMIGAERHD